MNVLVTGGAGYIGSTLIVKLLDEGHGVVSIDDLSRGDYKYLRKYEGNPRLKLVVGDICNIEKLEAVVNFVFERAYKRRLETVISLGFCDRYLLDIL